MVSQRDYDAPFTSIPAHGRHQHFCVGGRDRIAHLLSTWENVDSTEKCRRLIDLFMVSVLLDAGAGTQWSYKSTENGRIYRRSEGIAVASLEMFKTVSFAIPHGTAASPFHGSNKLDRVSSQVTRAASTKSTRTGCATSMSSRWPRACSQNPATRWRV